MVSLESLQLTDCGLPHWRRTGNDENENKIWASPSFNNEGGAVLFLWLPLQNPANLFSAFVSLASSSPPSLTKPSPPTAPLLAFNPPSSRASALLASWA
ncbi:hypothetical protein Drorol1_Dr00003761 [Drosera rotundifolia]